LNVLLDLRFELQQVSDVSIEYLNVLLEIHFELQQVSRRDRCIMAISDSAFQGNQNKEMEAGKVQNCYQTATERTLITTDHG